MELSKSAQDLDPNTIPDLGEDAIYYFAMRELSMPEFIAVMRMMSFKGEARPGIYVKALHKRCPWIKETMKLEANKSVYWKYKSDRGQLKEGVNWDQGTLIVANEYITNYFKEEG